MDPLTRAEKLKSVRSRIKLIITRLVNRNLKSHLLVNPQLTILNVQKKKVIFVFNSNSVTPKLSKELIFLLRLGTACLGLPSFITEPSE